MTKCRVCKRDITNRREFWHHARDLRDQYFCGKVCLREFIEDKTYRTLDQDIFEIFRKRDIKIISEIVHYDKKKKCFVWTIKGRKKLKRKGRRKQKGI